MTVYDGGFRPPKNRYTRRGKPRPLFNSPRLSSLLPRARSASADGVPTEPERRDPRFAELDRLIALEKLNSTPRELRAAGDWDDYPDLELEESDREEHA